MGLFDRIFKKPQPSGRNEGYFQTLTAYAPAFTTWGGRMYESELVRAAIDARARHISKLDITIEGAARPKMQTRLKHAPNDWQTWSQFLYRLSTILDIQNTAFIVPVLDTFGDVCGVYPVLPSRCEIVQYSGKPYLRYQFSNGKTAAVELEQCGIMTKFQYEDDFFGESNRALDDTLKLIDMQNQGISEAVRNSNTFRFMARINNFTKPEDLAKERLRFNRENLQADGGGLLLFPNTYTDIKQIDAKSYTVDADQMKLIQTNVCNYFGVNEDVLQSKAFGDSWSAFFESVISVFALQFSEAMSKMLFSQRERSQGSSIRANANRWQYMSNRDKLELANKLSDRGVITRNEIRTLFNLPLLPSELGDTLPVRGEYYNLGQDPSKDVGDGDRREDDEREGDGDAGEDGQGISVSE